MLFLSECVAETTGRLGFCHCSWMRFTIPSWIKDSLASFCPNCHSEENGRQEEHRSVQIQKHLEWVSSGEQGPQPFPRSQIEGWEGWRLGTWGHSICSGLYSYIPLLFGTTGEVWCLPQGRQISGKWAGWPPPHSFTYLVFSIFLLVQGVFFIIDKVQQEVWKEVERGKLVCSGIESLICKVLLLLLMLPYGMIQDREQGQRSLLGSGCDISEVRVKFIFGLVHCFIWP